MGLFSILYVVEMKWNVILEQGLPPFHESSWKTKTASTRQRFRRQTAGLLNRTGHVQVGGRALTSALMGISTI